MDLGNSALSENLAEWAFYAAFPILRTARSSRLLTASRAAILNCHYRPKSARPLLTICGTGGRPAAVDAYFSWRERPQQVSKVNLGSAPSGIGSIWDRLHGGPRTGAGRDRFSSQRRPPVPPRTRLSDAPARRHAAGLEATGSSRQPARRRFRAGLHRRGSE